MKLKYSDEAKQELENIYNIIASDSRKNAVNVFNGILDEIDRLKVFPDLGKALKYQLRSLIILRRYYVVYYHEHDIVYVLLIWDCRRNPEDFNRVFQ